MDEKLEWMHSDEQFNNAQKAIAAIWQLEKTKNVRLRWELKNTINMATKCDHNAFRKRIAYCIDAPRTTQWIGEMISVNHIFTQNTYLFYLEYIVGYANDNKK